MRYRTVVAASCLLLAGLSAHAAETLSIHTDTAGELAEVCGVNPRAPAADARINFCHGFAQGALDTQRAIAPDKRLFCLPRSGGPSRAETMNQFVAWVRAIPGRQTMPSVEGLFRFLGERFPCKP